MSIKFLVLGGGYFGFWGGGGCRFYFYGRADFSEKLVVSNLVCNFYAEALFCALLCPSVLFSGLAFALCAPLHAPADDRD